MLFRLFLDLIYFHSIAHLFAYEGLTDARTPVSAATSWAVLLASYLFVHKILTNDTGRNSNIIVTTLYYVSFVPFTTCISAGIASTGFIIYNTVYWFALLFFQTVSETAEIEPFARIRAGELGLREITIAAIGVLSLIVIIFISWKYTGFRLTFNLFSVYDLRTEAKGYAFPKVLAYLFLWVRAVNPVLLGYSLVRKKWTLAAFFFGAQMLSFGVNGLKTTFFMPFVVIFVVLFSTYGAYPNIKKVIISGLCAVMILAIAETMIAHTTNITHLVVRRVFFVPNYLGECYYDFFSKNPPDYFRGSFLRHLGLSSPYTADGAKGFTYIIGLQYYGRLQMNCNNGLSSDAMANLGIFGCFIMPLALIIVLRIFDRSTVNVSSVVSITPALFIAYNLISTMLTTVLLTHGMIILIIMMMILGNNPEDEDIQQYSNNISASKEKPRIALNS